MKKSWKKTLAMLVVLLITLPTAMAFGGEIQIVEPQATAQAQQTIAPQSQGVVNTAPEQTKEKGFFALAFEGIKQGDWEKVKGAISPYGGYIYLVFVVLSVFAAVYITSIKRHSFFIRLLSFIMALLFPLLGVLFAGFLPIKRDRRG